MATSQKAVAKYKKNNIKQTSIQMNIKTDADIIEHLEKQPNKQGYLKKLIRDDIARGAK